MSRKDMMGNQEGFGHWCRDFESDAMPFHYFDNGDCFRYRPWPQFLTRATGGSEPTYTEVVRAMHSGADFSTTYRLLFSALEGLPNLRKMTRADKGLSPGFCQVFDVDIAEKAEKEASFYRREYGGPGQRDASYAKESHQRSDGEFL